MDPGEVSQTLKIQVHSGDGLGFYINRVGNAKTALQNWDLDPSQYSPMNSRSNRWTENWSRNWRPSQSIIDCWSRARWRRASRSANPEASPPCALWSALEPTSDFLQHHLLTIDAGIGSFKPAQACLYGLQEENVKGNDNFLVTDSVTGNGAILGGLKGVIRWTQ